MMMLSPEAEPVAMVMLTHRQRQVVASGTRPPASAWPALSILPSTHPTDSAGTRVAMEAGRVHRLHPPPSLTCHSRKMTEVVWPLMT